MLKSENYYRRRVLEYSFKNQLIHVTSCLNAVPVLCEIYRQKKKDDKVILSAGHTYIAQKIILKDLGLKYLDSKITHPQRYGDVHCSTGSLGMGFPISIGIALANSKNTVYVVSSDGEFLEGACWESLRLMADIPVKNVILYLVANGYSAYGEVNMPELLERIMPFCTKNKQVICHIPEEIPYFLNGPDNHYHRLIEHEYKELMRYYK